MFIFPVSKCTRICFTKHKSASCLFGFLNWMVKKIQLLFTKELHFETRNLFHDFNHLIFFPKQVEMFHIIRTSPELQNWHFRWHMVVSGPSDTWGKLALRRPERCVNLTWQRAAKPGQIILTGIPSRGGSAWNPGSPHLPPFQQKVSSGANSWHAQRQDPEPAPSHCSAGLPRLAASGRRPPPHTGACPSPAQPCGPRRPFSPPNRQTSSRLRCCPSWTTGALSGPASPGPRSAWTSLQPLFWSSFQAEANTGEPPRFLDFTLTSRKRCRS